MSKSMWRVVMLTAGATLASLGLGLLAPSAGAAPCPNDAFRTGPSATLPDCRAYELVSPPESNGRYLGSLQRYGFEALADFFPTELASPVRDSVIYETFQSPLLSPPGPNGNADLYEAVRTPNGWTTARRLSPSGEQAVLPILGGVSSDHTYTFTYVGLIRGIGPPRIGGSLAGEIGATYLSNPDGSFELVGRGSLGEEPLAQGRYISPGGKHVIFSTGKVPGQSPRCTSQPKCKVLKLEPNAAPTGTGTVYDREADGPTHVVSLLPGDVPQAAGQEAFYRGASKDGSSIAFEIEGTLYVRVNNGEAGEKTVKASEGNPVYAGLSDDGKYLFYVAGGEKGTIHRFDTETEVDVPVNPTAAGEVVNVSADGSHVYFISEEQIGILGTAGQPNMYEWDEGSPIEFVATVAPSDLGRTSGDVPGIPALTRWTSWAVISGGEYERGPGAESSRTTPDGKYLVFESKAKLTSYENAGHTEVYRYDDAADELICVSCNPDPGAGPATADAQLQDLRSASVGTVIHNITDDGSRVFFETKEALTAADTAATNDIYEWQQEAAATRVDLISSGHSPEYPPGEGGEEAQAVPHPNVLLSVTPDAQDVLFMTQEPLVPGAGEFGTEALYDARVGGGFPQPAIPRACVEDECRAKTGTSPGALSKEKSSSQKGPGNIKPKRHKHRCHKAKAKKGGKAPRCTRRHGKKHHAAKKQAASGTAAQTTTTAAAAPSTTAGSEEAAQRPAQEPTAASPSTRAPVGDFNAFGIESLSGSLSTTAAGAHPDFTTSFSLSHETTSEGKSYSDAHAEEVSVSLPPGLIGNPNAYPRCEVGLFVAFANCPTASQVGTARVEITNQGTAVVSIFNLTPPHPNQEVARLGFYAVLPVFIDVKVRTASDYGVTATVHSPPSLQGVLASETTLWGNPSDPVHDPLRMTAQESLACEFACNADEGKREVPRTDLAFMTNPSACQSGNIDLQAKAYQLPGKVFSASAPLPAIDSCQGLPFAPTFNATPTTHKAGAPTGLDTTLLLPQHLGADEPATATMREARVTLPEGMQVNPAAANWIEACSAAQVGYHQEVDANCPNGSRLGTATIKSPTLSSPISGNLYQRTPEPGHQLGLWLAVDALGLHVKLPGELEPDKQTGRLTAVFRDLPQVPVEEIDLNVWGGSRAPLINPSACGTFQTDFSFAPHSNDPAAFGKSQMQINEGCNAAFDPKLSAGTTKPKAGKHSPLIVDLERSDADQALRGFELTLPDGLLAKIKGVGRCSSAQADAGACPAASRLGTVVASAGAGPDPLWIPQPGRVEPGVYLGGPYKDSPLSVITLVPAQAGPFDLGTLVVRSGLGLDPDTNRPVIDADALPQFFEGIGLSYRTLHVTIDRPGFVLNPTDCRAMRVNSTVTSTQGTVAHPSTRFKVTGCKRLRFKPRLSLTLKGGTERSDYPALTATLKARKGDANISRARVSLPHSEFLAQEHIATICTRKQFAADKCPKGSVYGYAEARTPLLAKPLKGPVYLRSSDNPLPDMVAALHGELDVNLVGEIDSHDGGIRTTFASVPDAPVTKFVLRMKGGKKGLLVNSTDVCAHPGRAQAGFTAQNGRAAQLRPRLDFKGCGGSKKGR